MLRYRLNKFGDNTSPCGISFQVCKRTSPFIVYICLIFLSYYVYTSLASFVLFVDIGRNAPFPFVLSVHNFTSPLSNSILRRVQDPQTKLLYFSPSSRWSSSIPLWKVRRMVVSQVVFFSKRSEMCKSSIFPSRLVVVVKRNDCLLSYVQCIKVCTERPPPLHLKEEKSLSSTDYMYFPSFPLPSDQTMIYMKNFSFLVEEIVEIFQEKR